MLCRDLVDQSLGHKRIGFHGLLNIRRNSCAFAAPERVPAGENHVLQTHHACGFGHPVLYCHILAGLGLLRGESPARLSGFRPRRSRRSGRFCQLLRLRSAGSQRHAGRARARRGQRSGYAFRRSLLRLVRLRKAHRLISWTADTNSKLGQIHRNNLLATSRLPPPAAPLTLLANAH
jgi:hypothetical protein